MSANTERPPRFNLPPEGEIVLPAIDISHNKEAEQILLNTIAESGRENEFLKLVPDSNFWSADFGRGGQVYIKPFFQRSQYLDKHRESHVLYAMDLSNDKRVMGMIFSVRHSEGPHDKENTPFVGYNQTRAGFYNLGLGLRRLIVLNEICKQLYGEKLGSTEFIYGPTDEGNPALIAWERLVAAGLAEKTDEGYQFIK